MIPGERTFPGRRSGFHSPLQPMVCLPIAPRSCPLSQGQSEGLGVQGRPSSDTIGSKDLAHDLFEIASDDMAQVGGSMPSCGSVFWASFLMLLGAQG